MPEVNTLLGNWNSLPNMREVEPFDGADDECLREIAAVLAKHGRTDRFGVALLHKHFDVAPGEVLLERTDIERRMLITEPVNLADVRSGDVMTTIWRFDAGVPYGCSYCNKNHCT